MIDPLVWVIVLVIMALGVAAGSFAEAALVTRLGWAAFNRSVTFTFAANISGIVIIAILAFMSVNLFTSAMSRGMAFGHSGEIDTQTSQVGLLLLMSAPLVLFVARRVLMSVLQVGQNGCGIWFYSGISAVSAWIVWLILLGFAVWLGFQVAG